MRVRKVILAYAVAAVLLAVPASAQTYDTNDGYQDGYAGEPDPCQEPPQEFWDWPYDQQRQWYIDHCGHRCPAPPEGETGWTEADWQQWHEGKCETYHTYNGDPAYAQPDYCPPPEEKGMDTSNWTEEDYDRYWYECYSANDPCYPPQESSDWSRYDWEMWYQSCDPYHANDCPLEPEAENWTDEQWYQWEYECYGQHDPCYPPYESRDWSRYQYEMWYQDCDAYYANDCPLPPEAEHWSDDQWRQWEYECYGQHDPCYPPPESDTWTQDQWRQWDDKCAGSEPGPAPHHDPCSPPPESKYWGPDQWDSFYRNCRAPQHEADMNCPAMPAESHNWTQAERDRWAFEHCDHPPCDPLPQDFWSWSEADRHQWFAEHCKPEVTTQDGDGDGENETEDAKDDLVDEGKKAANDAIDNSNLTDEEKAALKNQTEQIVVPGPSPLVLLAGLGLVGLALRRRF